MYIYNVCIYKTYSYNIYIYIHTIYKVIFSKPGDGLMDPSFIMWGLVIGRRYIPCIVAVSNISYAIFDATTPCQPTKYHLVTQQSY